MKVVQKLTIGLNKKEKQTLRDANDIITDIFEALLAAKEKGDPSLQEGLIAPECFWSLRYHILEMESKDLFPAVKVRTE